MTAYLCMKVRESTREREIQSIFSLSVYVCICVCIYVCIFMYVYLCLHLCLCLWS